VDRTNLIENWLKNQLDDGYIIEPASSDASFRSYFRIFDKDKTYILMDAPPDKESIKDFIKISRMLVNAGLEAPKVLSFSENLGLILMSDLGQDTFLDKLSDQNVTHLYGLARNSLISMQSKIETKDIKIYSNQLLTEEMNLFPDWYLAKYKNFKLEEKDVSSLKQLFILISGYIDSQPKYFVHRDYHSRNLIYPMGSGMPGILDFQDAVYGAASYDLVSLLKDAYIEWNEDVILDQVARYWEEARKVGLISNLDFSDFYKEFEWTGVQRHLKILGIFSRLSIRDKKNQYLKNIPLIEKYLLNTTARYKELHVLRKILDKVII
jgi:aminoglycoside/choline kinase family phosphotransferase|tara:strand:+ start:1143 stop:2111 length:969 start_codon:yes stop_codon:yes gene_type:complete